MKLSQLTEVKHSVPKLVKAGHLRRKPITQSKPDHIKLKNNSEAIPSAEAKTLKEFIATVIAERLIGPST